jgi:hypothetical protein
VVKRVHKDLLLSRTIISIGSPGGKLKSFQASERPVRGALKQKNPVIWPRYGAEALIMDDIARPVLQGFLAGEKG